MFRECEWKRIAGLRDIIIWEIITTKVPLLHADVKLELTRDTPK